jgi:hypothetical protein
MLLRGGEACDLCLRLLVVLADPSDADELADVVGGEHALMGLEQEPVDPDDGEQRLVGLAAHVGERSRPSPIGGATGLVVSGGGLQGVVPRPAGTIAHSLGTIVARLERRLD